MPLDPNISLSYQPPQIQNPLATLAQVQALKSGQMEMQQQQRALAGQQALDEAFRSAVTTGPDGTPMFNRQAVSDSLSQGGFGHLLPGVMKSLTDTETAYADLAKKKADLTKLNQDIAQNNLDAGGLLGLSVQKAGNTPGAALGAIAFAKAHGQLDAATADSFAQQITANPTTEAVKQLTDNLIAQSPKAQAILKGQQETATAKATEAYRQGQQKKLEEEEPERKAKALRDKYSGFVAPLLRTFGTPAYQDEWNKLPADMQAIAPQNPATLADILNPGRTAQEIAQGLQQQSTAGEWVSYHADYLRRHPGATEQEITRQYKLDSQTPPQMLLVVPNAQGGGTVVTAKPGLTVGPGTTTAAGYSGEQVAANKAQVALQKAAVDSKNDYQTAQTLAANPSATNDLALLMQYIGATKPEALGKLRLNNNEINLVLGTRSAFGNLEALGQKLTSGEMLTSDQRQQMLSTMKLLTDAKVRAAQPGTGTGAGTAPQYQPGQTVMYNGKPHRISAVDPQTGKLTLEP